MQLNIIRTWVIAVVTTLISCIAWQWPVREISENIILAVTFLDIGQGDAILIEAPDGQVVLIDGGKPEGGIIRELSESLPWYEHTIDLMILTHPDDDHGGGLVEVTRRYDVRRVVYNGLVHDTPSYVALLDEVRRQSLPVTIIDRPQRIDLGTGVYLDIVYPLASIAGTTSETPNDTSIVARLVYGETTFLLTGDLEAAGEAALLGSGQALQSDVLKIGHHGSDSSTSEAFVAAVAPEHSVVSVGVDNDYGHPSRRVLHRLERAGAQVWRTDRQGRVEMRTNGVTLEIQTEQ